MRSGKARIGVVAVQGAFMAHAAMLARIGAEPVLVREPSDIAGGLDGLVLPGGESTAMTLLMQANGLWGAVADHLASGRPVLATCAGAILLARQVLDGEPDQESFAAVDVTVRRNGFGRQADSFEADVAMADGPPFPGVFIRAPLIEHAGPGVHVLAWISGGAHQRTPALCRSANVLLATFHPELTADPRIHHEAFGGPGAAGALAAGAPSRKLVSAGG